MDTYKLRKILIRKSSVDGNPVDDALMIKIPKFYKELVRGISNISLKSSLWFNYAKDNEIKEYWIDFLYGTNEILKEKKILEELCIDYAPYHLLYELQYALKQNKIKLKKLYKNEIIDKSTFDYLKSKKIDKAVKFGEGFKELYYNEQMLNNIEDFLTTSKKISDEDAKKVLIYVNIIRFTKILIPIGTSDGHTQVCLVTDSNGENCEVLFVDHEFGEEYKISESISDFFNNAYFKRGNYCFEVTEVNQELADEINNIIKSYFDDSFIVTLSTLHKSLKEPAENIYHASNKVSIRLKANRFDNSNELRENQYDGDLIILSIMPRATYTDEKDLSDYEIIQYDDICKRLNKLPNIKQLHRFGKERIIDLLKKSEDYDSNGKE